MATFTSIEDFQHIIKPGNSEDWLVFADWLEEHADKRARWLRQFVAAGVHPNAYRGYWDNVPRYGFELTDPGGLFRLAEASDRDLDKFGWPTADHWLWSVHASRIKYPNPMAALLALADACVENTEGD